MTLTEKCFYDLVGIRGVCEPPAGISPQFWLEDLPGITISTLAEVAHPDQPTGEKLGKNIIERAARFLIADIEGIYNSGYRVNTLLVDGCSTCTFTDIYSMGTQLGVVVKNNSLSLYSKLIIRDLTVKINNAGTYHVVIDDGISAQVIEHNFSAGIEVQFTNINYKTDQKQLTIYIQENDAQLAQLFCNPNSGGCSCRSKSPIDTHSIIFQGSSNGTTQTLAFGFIPCAEIVCESDLLMCNLAKAAPRLMGLTMLYKAAELYFSEKRVSSRNSRVVVNQDAHENEKEENPARHYAKEYMNRLNGKGMRGVKDAVMSVLQNSKDRCIICDNTLIRSAWATG